GDPDGAVALLNDAVEIAERFDDAELLAGANAVPGDDPHQPGAGRRGTAVPRRGDGRGGRRRALAVPDGCRLLRRDRVLRGGLRRAPGTGMDERARALVRGPAADGGLHRPVPGPPRRNPPARWRLERRTYGGAPRPRALRRGHEPGRG